MRRARRSDRAAALAVDARSFDPFWRLDPAGLDEAVDATPSSRFRVIDGPDGVVGYAVSGRAGARGFLQRLAVDPAVRGRGYGSALVVDGLRWMKRRGAARAMVNTQERNNDALRLYERLGFRPPTRWPRGAAHRSGVRRVAQVVLDGRVLPRGVRGDRAACGRDAGGRPRRRVEPTSSA